MTRHTRNRDALWLTSGLPFLTWAAAGDTAPEAARTTRDAPPTAKAGQALCAATRGRSLARRPEDRISATA